MDVPPERNTVARTADRPDPEASMKELDEMLDAEWKAGTLTEAEMAAVDEADALVKSADSAARGLFAAATCIFRKV